MSEIDNLSTQFSLHGVAYYELGEIASTVSGLKGKTKSDFSDGNARFITYRNIHGNIAVDQSSEDFVKVSPGEAQNELKLGDVLFTGSSENIEEVGLSSVVDTPPIEAVYFNSFCFALRFDDTIPILPGYSKYLFRSSAVRQQIIKSANGVTRINISKSKFLKTRIPIPSLDIQRAIIEVLDNFTALEAELEAELEARKKQYDFYRLELLSFDEAVQWLTVDDLCEVTRGRVMSKDYLAANAGQYPVYSSQTANSGIFGWIDTYDYQDESITWTTDGANAGSVFYHIDKKFSITNVCGLLRIKPGADVTTKYLYHCLSIMTKRHVSAGMGNPKLMSTAMKKIKVPIPSRAEQERVVKVLDKFDALVNDLSSGLPAEIAARRKQYEYYRDQLLTFKELAS